MKSGACPSTMTARRVTFTSGSVERIAETFGVEGKSKDWIGPLSWRVRSSNVEPGRLRSMTVSGSRSPFGTRRNAMMELRSLLSTSSMLTLLSMPAKLRMRRPTRSKFSSKTRMGPISAMRTRPVRSSSAAKP
jgi:hypothetical protein